MTSGLSSHTHWALSAFKDVALRKDRTKWNTVVLGSDALPVKVSACKHRVNLLFLHCLISHLTLYNNILMYQCRIAQCKIQSPLLSALWRSTSYYGVPPFLRSILQRHPMLKGSIATTLPILVFCIYHHTFYSWRIYFRLLAFLVSVNAD